MPETLQREPLYPHVKDAAGFAGPELEIPKRCEEVILLLTGPWVVKRLPPELHESMPRTLVGDRS